MSRNVSHHHQLKPLTSSEKAYNKAFTRYLQLTKKTQLTIDYLRSDTFSAILEKLDLTNSSSTNQQRGERECHVEEVGNSSSLLNQQQLVISYCGIGSGTGIKDIVIFKLLRRIYPNHRIHALIIEPNAENFEDFKSNLQEASILPGLELDWLKMNADEARESTAYRDRQFHLIVIMEALYYEKDLDAALSSYIDHLKEEGERSLLLISQGNSQCAWNILNREIAPHLDLPHVPGSDEVVQSLLKLQQKGNFTLEKFENSFPIDEVFEENSERGNTLLDFISHCADFRATASKDVRESFLKRLQEVCVRDQHQQQHFMFDMSFILFCVRRGPRA